MINFFHCKLYAKMHAPAVNVKDRTISLANIHRHFQYHKNIAYAYRQLNDCLSLKENSKSDKIAFFFLSQDMLKANRKCIQRKWV